MKNLNLFSTLYLNFELYFSIVNYLNDLYHICLNKQFELLQINSHILIYFKIKRNNESAIIQIPIKKKLN